MVETKDRALGNDLIGYCTSCFKGYELHEIDVNKKQYDTNISKCKCGGVICEMDRLILPTIQELNIKGYKTNYCCSGHLNSEFYGTYICFEGSIPSEMKIPSFMYSKKFKAIPEHGVGASESIYLNYDVDELPAEKAMLKLVQINKDLLEWAKALPSIAVQTLNNQQNKIKGSFIMKETLKRAMGVQVSYGFDHLVLSFEGKMYRGVQILSVMAAHENAIPASATLQVFGADCLNHPNTILQPQQLYLNTLPLDLKVVNVYTMDSKGTLSTVERYDLRAVAQFDTRLPNWLNDVPEELLEDYEFCLLKIFKHLVHNNINICLYNPEDPQHRKYGVYRTNMQAIAGKRSAKLLHLAKSITFKTGKNATKAVSELMIQPTGFTTVTPGFYLDATGNGIGTNGKEDEGKDKGKARYVEGKCILVDLSKAEKRYTVSHSSGLRVAPLSSYKEYGIKSVTTEKDVEGLGEVKHTVRTIEGVGKFHQYEIFFATPFKYVVKVNGQKVVKEITSFKIAAIDGDAVARPDLKDVKVIDLKDKDDSNAKDQKNDSSLGFIEVPEKVTAMYDEQTKVLMDFVDAQKADKTLPIPKEVEKALKAGNIVTDGSMYHNHPVGQFLFANRYLGSAMQNFQFRMNPACKGFSFRHDEVCKFFGVDFVMFASAKKLSVMNEWITKQNFQFAILNTTNHTPDSFKALPSSVVQNLMLDMGNGKKLLDKKREEAFIHARKLFTEKEAAYLEFDSEGELNEDLFGAAKTLAANPLLINERYHREAMAKEILKSLRKQGEGYVFLKGTRTLYLAADPLAVENALKDGSVLVDKNGFITAIVIDKKHCEIQKGQAVVADLAKNGEALNGKAIFARTPNQSAEELLLVDMVVTEKYKKALKSGHFKGMVLLPACDWSAHQMSGADYDGDFAFIIVDKDIVAYFSDYSKKNKLMPKLNKWIRFIGESAIEIGDGCPFKGVKDVVDSERFVRHAERLMEELGLPEYAGKFEIYEDQMSSSFHAEFSIDMPEDVCNEFIAHFNSCIIERSLTLNDIGKLANRLMLLQELHAYYEAMLNEVVATNSLVVVSKFILKDHIGNTVTEAVSFFENAIADIVDMKDVLQIAAWMEIDAPKHGGAYKPFVQIIETIFKRVEVGGLNREDRITKVFKEKGAFAPLFLRNNYFNPKVTKLNPVKQRWLANQKQENKSTDFIYVTGGEERRGTPISLYAFESEAIYRKDISEHFATEIANHTPIVPIFTELFGKEKLALYAPYAAKLAAMIRVASSTKRSYESKLVNMVNDELFKKDLLTDHMKYRKDIVTAQVKKMKPAETMNIKKHFAKTVRHALNTVGKEAIANIPDFNAMLLFAEYLKIASKGTKAQPAVAWNVLEKYALELVRLPEFTAAYEKAIAERKQAVVEAPQETPAVQTNVVATPKRTITGLASAPQLDLEVRHEAPPVVEVEAPKRGGRGIKGLGVAPALDFEVK
jgi:hypothetical protein